MKTDQLTTALQISFSLIRHLETFKGFSMSEPIRETEKECNCTIDGASPMHIWEHFKDENGTGLRVHMAYTKDRHSWGLPIVSQLEAIPNLVAFYQL